HVRCPQRTWILLDRTSHVACMLLVSFRLVPAISVSVSFCSRQNRDQPSFPTRRSSDLCGRQRRVNARTDDGGAVCVTCYARCRRSEDMCDECGTIGPLATRAGGKRPGAANLCGRCYRNPRRVCGVCGRLKRVALKATATSPDVCPTCYQAPVVDCSICGQQALGRRTTNHGRPRCFACQAAQQIDAALTGPDGMIRPELRPVR